MSTPSLVEIGHERKKWWSIYVEKASTNGDTENVEDVDCNLTKATEGVALATLPKKKRRSKLKPSASKRVLDARIKLKSISFAYHEAPSPSRGVGLSRAKKELDDAYLEGRRL